MSDPDGDGGLLARLGAKRDWENAVKKAERSGDLTEIAALLRSHGLALLARLLDDHRLKRKKRGGWKSSFEPSAEEKYAEAATWVRSIEAMKREGGAGIRMMYGEWAKDMTFKVHQDRLDDIDDPVAYVAKRKGLGAKTLRNTMLGKTGFGRGRKRKPKPDGSASE
jgi:hypothetical protein